MSAVHTAGHQLPISNGYSVINGAVFVYCGRCMGDFDPDREWVERYMAAKRKRCEDSLARERARVLGQLADEEAGLRVVAQ